MARNRVHLDLQFGTEGNASPNLLYGWHPPEQSWNWTDGLESAVSIPGLAGRGENIFIEVTCGSIERPEYQQTLSVKINGTAPSHSTDISNGTYAWMAPKLPNNDAAVILRLLHPEAIIPREIGFSDDPRQLSIAMRRLRVLLSDEVTGPLQVASASLEGDPVASAEARAGMPVKQLLLEFESLGDNCELGLVQRRLGVEPLGLLRFSTAFLPEVLRGVDTSFAGLGDQLDTEMEGVEREWMVRDHGYHLRWHTFILGANSSKAAVMERERKKTAFLKIKFLRDLTAAEKIYVVKSLEQPAGYEQILALHLALNRHATNWLLWVTPVEDPAQVGFVEELFPRLLHGRIDRFSRHNVADDESISGWLAVLTSAWLLAGRSAAR